MVRFHWSSSRSRPPKLLAPGRARYEVQSSTGPSFFGRFIFPAVPSAACSFHLLPHTDQLRCIASFMMYQCVSKTMRQWLLTIVTISVAALACIADEDRSSNAEVASESSAPSEENKSPEPTTVRPFEDIVVFPDSRRIEIRAWTCLEAGYLEQIACSPGTREHESLVVIRAKPSQIHAALLMAGFESGRPGQWEFDPETQALTLTDPRGSEIDVWFAYEKDGERIVDSARRWIRDHHEKQRFPETPWIFGGSLFRPNPEWMGPGEHYVADITGSIIGLVTFGDEVLGFKQVISDQAAVHEPEWMVHTDRVPPEGTEVTVILLPFGERPDGAEGADATANEEPVDEADGEAVNDQADDNAA